MCDDLVPLTGKCSVCGVESTSRCAGCYGAFYCGADHQKQDWRGNDHKARCKKPFRIEKTADLGRFMVASRDLRAGDIVLKERVCVHTPNLENSPPVCVVCYRLLSPASFRPCKRCLVPTCGEECAKSDAHKGECDILKRCPRGFYSKYEKGRLSQLGDKEPPSLDRANYGLLVPIRVWLLKMSDVKRYKTLMGLQSHIEERREREAWENDRSLLAYNRLSTLLEQYKIHELDKDTVEKICGIFDTNAFNLMSHKDGGGSVDLTGLFPSAAMLMHSCIKNTKLVHDSDFNMTVYAREPIKSGEVIYHSYSQLLVPTNLRRLLLLIGKHFGCECRRCTDPSELGSLASGVSCKECDGGVMLPECPIDIHSVWRCKKCAGIAPGMELIAQERRVSLELENIPKTDVYALEEFVAKYSPVLNPRHSLVVAAKQLCSVGYGRSKKCSSEREKRRKVELCREVLEAMRTLETGIATRIGLAAFELASALVSLGEKKNLGEARRLLEETILILDYDPKDTNHGKLADVARKQLLSLN